MASHAAISKLARNIRRPDLPPWAPRTQYPVFHVGFLSNVDSGRNVASFEWNDPSGEITAGVPYALSYSPTHLPEAGHLVQMLQYGSSLQIFNRIIVPDDFIIVP